MLLEPWRQTIASPIVSIVIPAHNESQHIGAAMWAIYETFVNTQWAVEIVVVDDGSKDSTRLEAQEVAERIPLTVKIVSLPTNRGKGRAIREGFRASTGSYVGFLDADLEYPVNALPLMVKMLMQAPDACAIATRVSDDRHFIERVSSRIAHKIASMVLQLPISDTQAGMKMFPGDFAREVLGNCQQEGWLYDIEALLRAVERKLTILEVPVSQQSIRPRRARLSTMLSCTPTLVNLAIEHWQNIRQQSGKEVRQILRFALVGITNTLTDMVVFWALVSLWHPGYRGWQAGLESLIAWIVASFVGYTLHSRYTFRGHLSRSGFYLVTGIGVTIETAVTAIVTQTFGSHDVLGKLFGIVMASMFTYGGYRYLAKNKQNYSRHTLITRVNIDPIGHSNRPPYPVNQQG